MSVIGYNCTVFSFKFDTRFYVQLVLLAGALHDRPQIYVCELSSVGNADNMMRNFVSLKDNYINREIIQNRQ